MKQQIAIVGTEGSGKTILATVWAKLMSQQTGGTFLSAQGMETSMYVEKAWHALNQGEWLPSTPPGQQFELQWNLHTQGMICPVKLIDVAGQDLRTLFSYGTYQAQGLTNQQLGMLQYLQESSVIIIVVNLKHFCGEADYIKCKENELILKEVIDMFAVDSKQQSIAIAFTAWDQYKGTVEKKHGSFQNYIMKELPLLYNATRAALASGDTVWFFPVAPVAETELKSREDGKPLHVPKPGFKSAGMDNLSNWLIKTVQQSQIRSQEEERIRKESEVLKKQKNWLERIKSCCGYGCLIVVVIYLFLCFLAFMMGEF